MSKKIEISGLAFSLSGWNGTFLRGDIIDYIWNGFGPPTYVGSDDKSYYMQSYWKWYIIPIATAQITFVNDHWELRFFRSEKVVCSNDTLLGTWNYGDMKVSIV